MKFSELTLHPAIARALDARGYETATGVQAAVLEPAHEGRDLLVSSQTGSGKTVAFGAVVAQTLLAGDALPRAERGAPLALVVVPTRELAVQVREELGWLLAETKLRLASFTGGTAVTGDLRALQTGVDVVVGTPGRLVDLVRRERLKLTAVRVVVLDEADEMLDLGFREDLTTLLQASPPERRTLLLSATMPPEIQAMAKRFQRDAARVDVRRTDPATGRAGHDDITYVAHLISGTDRLAVVVNVLRAAGDGRAIVFVTTRDSVSRLHAALTARGFAATAISGERAQTERDRALEQLRKGEARVLVATNVAARGLHLPDVDLIVHADLPLNAESLTHRSGRTGRAGRKGTAVVIAGLSERRKAERLLAMAHVNYTWTPPPTAESITDAARERLVETLLESEAEAAETTADSGGAPGAPLDAAAVKAAKAAAYRARKVAAAEALLQRMEATVDARELARRLLLRELERLPAGEKVQAVSIAPAGARRDDVRDTGSRPGRADFARSGVVFRINIGAKDNADPRWLLPLICRRGGVTRHDVGAIRIGPRDTEFQIAPGAAEDFALSAAEQDPRAPHVVITRADGARPPAHHAAAPRPHAPASRPPTHATRAHAPAPRAEDAAPRAHAPAPRAHGPAPRVHPPAPRAHDTAPRPHASAPPSQPAAPRPTPKPHVAKPTPASAAAPAPRPPAPSVASSRTEPVRDRAAPPSKSDRAQGPMIETKRARPIAAPARPSYQPSAARPPAPHGNTQPRRIAPPTHQKPSFQARAADGSGPPRRSPPSHKPGAAPPARRAPAAPSERAPFWKSGARKRPSS